MCLRLLIGLDESSDNTIDESKRTEKLKTVNFDLAAWQRWSTGFFSMCDIQFPERGDKAAVEEGVQLQPKFDADGLIPCICQDAESGEVLMFAFMNAESLGLTITTGLAHYYSRSRRKLWKKGEQSGNMQVVKDLRVDCDQDVILIRADTQGAASCHTGFRSCFFRSLDSESADPLALKINGGEKLFDPESVYGK